MIRIAAVVKHQERDRSKICDMNCVLCRTPCVKQKKYARREMPETAFGPVRATPLPFPGTPPGNTDPHRE